MRRFMGSQRVGHDWVTGLNWTEYFWEHWNEALTLQGPERLCVTMSPSFKLLRFSPVATMKTVHMPGYNNSLQSPFRSLSNLSLLIYREHLLQYNNEALPYIIKTIFLVLWKMVAESMASVFLCSHHLRGHMIYKRSVNELQDICICVNPDDKQIWYILSCHIVHFSLKVYSHL